MGIGSTTTAAAITAAAALSAAETEEASALGAVGDGLRGCVREPALDDVFQVFQFLPAVVVANVEFKVGFFVG